MSLHEAIAGVAASSVMQYGRAQHAIVCAVDPIKHLVQVTLQPSGLTSGWLPDPGLATGGLRIAAPCEVGTQVLVAPVEGDAENPVIVARVFDLVARPPTSPVTGKPAQPGELLAVSGAGVPSMTTGGPVSAPVANAAWFHLTTAGFFAGAGTMKLAITPEAITLTADGSTLTLTKASLAAMGAALSTDQDVSAGDVSLKTHLHLSAGGSGLSGEPKQ